MKIKISASLLMTICIILIVGCGYRTQETEQTEKSEVTTIVYEVSDEEKVPIDETETTEIIETEKFEEASEKEQSETIQFIPDKKDDTLIKSLDFSLEDAIKLQKIAVAEAGGESVESMALVMLVVLNRAWSDEFPNSIEGVIFQNVSGVAQFSPVPNGAYDEAEPNEKSFQALELVLSGWNKSQNALYFETCNGSSWHSNNLDFLFEIDGIRFYK